MDNSTLQRSLTGVPGLDDVLHGGLIGGRFYLLDGNPGAGKTTLALQYLLEGIRAGERCLYVTLSETRDELIAGARSHGWSLDGIEIVELIGDERDIDGDQELTMYHPSEVELTQTTRKVLDAVERCRPAADGVRLPVRATPAGAKFPALPATDPRAETVLRRPGLHRAPARRPHGGRPRPAAAQHRAWRDLAGPPLARLRPARGRCRWSSFAAAISAAASTTWRSERGAGDLPAPERQRTPGVVRSRRPSPAALRRWTPCWAAASIAARPRSVGPPGSGKSTVALQFAVAAAGRGDHAAVFAFDETKSILLRRAKGWASTSTKEPVQARSWCGKSTRPRSRRANSPISCAESVERDQRTHRHHRQPQRLSQRDARATVPVRAVA